MCSEDDQPRVQHPRECPNCGAAIVFESRCIGPDESGLFLQYERGRWDCSAQCHITDRAGFERSLAEWTAQQQATARSQPTLVEWLREQLDEDERIASTADSRRGDGRWWVGAAKWGWGDPNFNTQIVGGGKPLADVDAEYSGPTTAEHIAEHDPDRVLREVAAKRAMVDYYVYKCDLANGHLGHSSDPELAGYHATGMGNALRFLASIYSHREGYDPNWRA